MITNPTDESLPLATPPPALPARIEEWPIDDIDPSPFQERRLFEEQAQRELADSIVAHGIIQPLTVRRVPGKKKLELVCGERRLRGGRQAGLAAVPVILRELSDAQAENIVLLENIQREDLTPTEQARSYDRLLKLRDEGGRLMHTRESVARVACKTLNHIDDHLKLLACPDQLTVAVDAGNVSVSTAMVVGRIPDPKLREVAAGMVLRPKFQEVPMNAAQAKLLVREQFMVSLAGVPWEMEDAGLVPEETEDDPENEGARRRCFGGACEDCRFRSANIAGAGVAVKEGKRGKRESGGADGNLCTLPPCHKAKMNAVYEVERRRALVDGKKALDDKEAEKQFYPGQDRLAYNSKYVRMDAKVEYDDLHHSYRDRAQGKMWKTLVKGAEPPLQVVVCKSPHTGRLVELGLAKEVKELAAKMLKGAGKPDESKTPAELRQEEEARERRALELRTEKVDKITLREGVNDLVAAILRRGFDADFLGYVFQMALDSGGTDGMTWMGQWLEVVLPKGGHHSGRDYEEGIIAKAKERCETPNAWMGFITVALLARDLKWQGLRCDDFEQVLGRFAIKVPALKRRAEALLAAEEKAKEKPSKKAPARQAGKDSTDPVEVDSAKEAGRTAAADRIAKGKGRRAKGEGRRAKGSEIKDGKAYVAAAGHPDLFAGGDAPASSLKAAGVSPPEEGPSSAEQLNGVQDSLLGKPQRFTVACVESAAGCLKAGTTTITTLLGPKPNKDANKKGYQVWNSVRMRLLRKAGLAGN